MDHVKPPDFVTFIDKGFGVCYTKFLVPEDLEFPNFNMKVISIAIDYLMLRTPKKYKRICIIQIQCFLKSSDDIRYKTEANITE